MRNVCVYVRSCLTWVFVRVCLCARARACRVQQEQLAAIFLLLRDNQEALGEATEGDMEEQFKLYSL